MCWKDGQNNPISCSSGQSSFLVTLFHVSECIIFTALISIGNYLFALFGHGHTFYLLLECALCDKDFSVLNAIFLTPGILCLL